MSIGAHRLTSLDCSAARSQCYRLFGHQTLTSKCYNQINLDKAFILKNDTNTVLETGLVGGWERQCVCVCVVTGLTVYMNPDPSVKQ